MPNKDKLLRAALRRQLITNPEDVKTLVRALISRAQAGDIVCLQMIREMVDKE